jgi:hypothetical protein
MSANIFTTYKGQVVLTIVGTKEECTKSLTEYPNYVGKIETPIKGIREYYYATQQEDVAVFIEARNEAHLDNPDYSC